MFSAFGQDAAECTCSVGTMAVTNVLVCGLQGCCIRQGTNQNIKCTCAKVRCLVLGQHIICKCPCTKFLAPVYHSQHHICRNFERNFFKETMRSDGGHIFCILLCLKLVLCVQYVSCIFFLFGATALQWARTLPFTMFLDHTHRRTTVGRNPLDR
jgi:hypothetical protein